MIMIVFMITSMSTQALAQDPYSEISGEGMIFDFVILRPLGIVTTAIGCVFFVASLPYTAWNEESYEKAKHCLITVPANYAFVRPLGQLKEDPDGS